MRTQHWLRIALMLAMALPAGACTGVIADPGASADGSGGGGAGRGGPGFSGDPLSAPAGLGASGIQRLSRAEYATTLEALLGVDIGADAELLPDDPQTPFDNDYTEQIASQALIEGLRLVAERATAAVLADPTRVSAVVGCAPSGPDDAACLRSFVERFGRRALRRPLTDEEVSAYLGLQRFAVAEGEFDVAVGLVLRAMLQDMELVYRVEIGTPVEGAPGVFRLNDWEVASRLSYLLTGAPPDDSLLDRAAAGDLGTSEAIREEARRLLASEAGAARLGRFHAMWLGYERLPHDAALSDAMRRETGALLERIVLEEQGSWLDLFRADETFVDANLALHYGLEPPATGGADWVSYGDTGRRGILSHGTFLSNGAKNGDTSPVLRGIAVRERLLCQEIPEPPPTVNTDEPPPPTESGSDCKEDRYSMHSQGGCAGCHQLIDPVGFGLENYDAAGRFRTHEPDRPECAIRGEGMVEELGSFTGPAELADLLIATNELDACAVKQLYRFAMGRGETVDDDATLDALLERFRESDHRLDSLLLDFVSSEAFRHRFVQEEE